MYLGWLQTNRLRKKISFGSHLMLSSASTFGVSVASGFGFSGSVGSTRGFAAMNVVKV